MSLGYMSFAARAAALGGSSLLHNEVKFQTAKQVVIDRHDHYHFPPRTIIAKLPTPLPF
jgi:hypothetical protein